VAVNVAKEETSKTASPEESKQIAERAPSDGARFQERASGDTPVRLWTVREVADFLGVHQKTVYHWVAVKGLVSIRLGNRVRFDPRDVLRWVSARRED